MTRPGRTAKGLWWDRAWTLVEGCTKVDETCAHCWAERLSAMRKHNRLVGEHHAGLTDEDGRWTGRVRLQFERLEMPLRATSSWTWALWNDLFHPGVPWPFAAQALDVMATADRQRFVVLTKRPERFQYVHWEMAEFWPGDTPYSTAMEMEGELSNVMWGTSAGTQAVVDERIDRLLAIPGRHVVSVEPMLESVDLDGWLWGPHAMRWNEYAGDEIVPAIDWVQIGCETGPGRRSVDPDAVRSLIRSCHDAGVPVFVKQLEIGGRVTSDMSCWPADLRVREYPEGW